MKKEIKKIMHEIKIRNLEVAKITDLSSQMRRITLKGPELAGFISMSPEDHVKVFFPNKPHGLPKTPTMSDTGPVFTDDIIMRDYTPRFFRPESNELDLDFSMHKNGPASQWAHSAQIGDPLSIAGPRGSSIFPEFQNYLLIGDDTSIPSIFRRIEELPKGVNVSALILVKDEAAEVNEVPIHPNLELIWLHHHGEYLTKGLELTKKGLRSLAPESSDALAVISGELSLVKDIKSELIENYEFNEEWIKATGYWKK